MSLSKRHHYLPQFYLEYFSKDGKLWIFDKKLNTYRVQTPTNTAVVGDYYSVIDEAKLKDTFIENNIAVVESVSKPIIEKLLRREPINLEEKKAVTFFLALLRVRVPKFEHAINNKISEYNLELAKEVFSDYEQAKKLIELARSEGGNVGDISPQIVMDAIKDGRIEFDVDRLASLDLIYPTSIDLSKRIFNMSWHLLFPPIDSKFITTDNPFIIIRPKELSSSDDKELVTPGSQVFIPIGSKGCFALEDNEYQSGFVDIPKKRVRQINIELARNCERFIIAEDELLLKNIVSKLKRYN